MLLKSAVILFLADLTFSSPHISIEKLNAHFGQYLPMALQAYINQTMNTPQDKQVWLNIPPAQLAGEAAVFAYINASNPSLYNRSMAMNGVIYAGMANMTAEAHNFTTHVLDNLAAVMVGGLYDNTTAIAQYAHDCFDAFKRLSPEGKTSIGILFENVNKLSGDKNYKKYSKKFKNMPIYWWLTPSS